MSKSRNLRLFGVLALAAGVVLGGGASASAAPDPNGGLSAMATAAADRPLFQLPFPCGEQWVLFTYGNHDDYDIDMQAIQGETRNRKIVAAASGTVYYAGWNQGGGNMVDIDHGGGWVTRYLHMIEAPAVRTGQRVEQGQLLGRVGHTGDGGGTKDHLHYEQLRMDGGPEWTKTEAYFDGKPSGIRDDATSPAVNLTSQNGCQSHQPSVNGDAKADMLYHAKTGAIGLRTGTGGGFADKGEITGGWGRWVNGKDLGRLEFADIDGDGRTDLIELAKSGEVKVHRGNGGGFGAADQLTDGWGRWVTGTDLGRLYFADVNGDGKADMIVHAKTGEISVRIGTGNGFADKGAFTSGWGRWVTGTDLGRLYFADVNGDGKADMVVHAKTGEISVRTGTGSGFADKGEFSTGWGRWVTGTDLGRLYFADIDGDNKADMVVHAKTGEISVRTGTGNGFADKGEFSSGWGRWVTGDDLGVLYFA